jgi:hypothetical protein
LLPQILSPLLVVDKSDDGWKKNQESQLLFRVFVRFMVSFILCSLHLFAHFEFSLFLSL